MKHIFKLTKTGFLVCNDKYIKVSDEKGPVNFFPSSKINATSAFQLVDKKNSNGEGLELSLDKLLNQ